MESAVHHRLIPASFLASSECVKQITIVRSFARSNENKNFENFAMKEGNKETVQATVVFDPQQSGHNPTLSPSSCSMPPLRW